MKTDVTSRMYACSIVYLVFLETRERFSVDGEHLMRFGGKRHFT